MECGLWTQTFAFIGVILTMVLIIWLCIIFTSFVEDWGWIKKQANEKLPKEIHEIDRKMNLGEGDIYSKIKDLESYVKKERRDLWRSIKSLSEEIYELSKKE